MIGRKTGEKSLQYVVIKLYLVVKTQNAFFFSSLPNVKFLGACKPMHIAQPTSLNIGTFNFKFVVFLSTNRI